MDEFDLPMGIGDAVLEFVLVVGQLSGTDGERIVVYLRTSAKELLDTGSLTLEPCLRNLRIANEIGLAAPDQT